MGKDRFKSTDKPSKASASGSSFKKGSSNIKSSQKKLQQNQKEKLWKSKSSKDSKGGNGTSKPKSQSGSKDKPKEPFKKSSQDKSSKTAKPTAKPVAGGKTHKPVDKKPAAAAVRMELVGNLKNDWNRVRVRTIGAEEKAKLISKLMASIKGHVLQVTLRHDVSRIVQCILQFGNEAQKSFILSEMQPKLFEISKTPYGHFTVLKAITYCTTATDQKKVVSSFTGHFVALGTNVIGARTVESILAIYPGKLTRALKAEFYGKVLSAIELRCTPPAHVLPSLINVVVVVVIIIIFLLLFVLP